MYVKAIHEIHIPGADEIMY